MGMQPTRPQRRRALVQFFNRRPNFITSFSVAIEIGRRRWRWQALVLCQMQEIVFGIPLATFNVPTYCVRTIRASQFGKFYCNKSVACTTLKQREERRREKEIIVKWWRKKNVSAFSPSHSSTYAFNTASIRPSNSLTLSHSLSSVFALNEQ